MSEAQRRALQGIVAPFTGAWIEIARYCWARYDLVVAPFTGAWIEIIRTNTAITVSSSLPSRERGLKYNVGTY